MAHRRAEDPAAVRVIAVNDAYRLAPFADLLYFADAQWWRWHKEKPEFKAFAGAMVTIEPTGLEVDDARVFMLRSARKDRFSDDHGLSTDPAAIADGRNSGYQAINLAALTGAKRIVLLGYDSKPGAAGEAHWFGNHPIPTHTATVNGFRKFYKQLVGPLKALGIEIVNCSPGSAITCFPKASLESVFPDPVGAALPA